MGKNKRRTLEAEDTVHGRTLQVDSQEEADFLLWLNEATRLGLVVDFEYQPKPFKLSNPVHYVDAISGRNRSLFREHVYTADFLLMVDSERNPALAAELRKPDPMKSSGTVGAYYIDVKGGFLANGSARSFPINQKWVYEKFHVYVHKLVPKDFFKKFGVVESLLWTQKTHRPSKKYAGYPVLGASPTGN